MEYTLLDVQRMTKMKELQAAYYTIKEQREDDTRLFIHCTNTLLTAKATSKQYRMIWKTREELKTKIISADLKLRVANNKIEKLIAKVLTPDKLADILNS